MSIFDFFGRGLGYIYDTVDDRDVLARDVLGSAPTFGTYSVRSSAPPKNQRNTSSCVGQAEARALREAYLAQEMPCPDLSALAIYYPARAFHDSEARDMGTQIRYAMKAVMRLGAASEETHPFSVLRVNTAPSLRAIHDGFTRRGLRGYYRISQGDIDAIRLAIKSGLPVIAGWDIDQAFKNYTGGVIQDITGTIVGGHAMVIDTAYSDGTFGIANSWGYWGERGFARVGIRFALKARDMWAIDVRA